MNNDRDVDALLRQHAEQQLAGFDWEGLRHGITRRIVARVGPKRRIRHRTWPAVAAAVIATVGIVGIVLFGVRKPGSDGAPSGGASVIMLAPAHVPGRAEVSLHPPDRLGQCEVKLIGSNGTREERQGKARLWIIAVRQPSADEADSADVAWLF